VELDPAASLPNQVVIASDEPLVIMLEP
jgi:hypothetical protein